MEPWPPKNRTIKYDKIMLNMDFDLPCRIHLEDVLEVLLDLNFNVPCRTSPECCSRNFPGC